MRVLSVILSAAPSEAPVISTLSVPAPPSILSFFVRVAPRVNTSSFVPPLTSRVAASLPKLDVNLPVKADASMVASISVPLAGVPL